MGQGSSTSTSRTFDLGIEGDGFFVVSDGTNSLFTRDGSFDIDAAGYLVDPTTGYRVQRLGTTGEDTGFQLTGNSGIKIPYNVTLPGAQTSTIDFKGNLSAGDLAPTNTELHAGDLTYTLTAGGYADASASFSDITQLQGWAAGDTITIAGHSHDGTAVSTTFTYGSGAGEDGVTLQSLLDKIQTAFGGADACSATIDDGKIVLKDDVAGYSMMDISLSSASHAGAVPTTFDFTSVGGAAAQTTKINVYDSQGRSHALTATFVRQSGSTNVWDLVINSCDGAGVSDRRIAGISFDRNGIYQGVTETDGFGHTSSDSGFGFLDANLVVNFTGVGSNQTITSDFGRVGFYDGLTQLGGSSSAGAINQDGYGAGSLQTVSIDKQGVVSGTFSNGQTLDIAALRLAVFDNPQGLERIGSNYYRYTPSAGATVYSSGTQGRAGKIRQGVLEDSNVDIVKQFSQLIIAQRGFQMNSRTLRTANTLLQQLTSIMS
jgi:flagellar hook protein FlgE